MSKLNGIFNHSFTGFSIILCKSNHTYLTEIFSYTICDNIRLVQKSIITYSSSTNNSSGKNKEVHVIKDGVSDSLKLNDDIFA